MGLEQLEAKVSADISDFQKKFDAMKTQLAGMAQSVAEPAKQANQSLGGIRDEVSRIGQVLTGGALIAGGKAITEAVTVPIIGLGKEMVVLADKQRQTEIAFTTMLGSAERAGAILRDLQAFAAATPFEFPDLVHASKRMLALGFDAEDLIPILTNVGDAAAGLGSGTQGLDRIITAMGQMNAKGRVTAEEMKQLTEAGIKAWDALATHLGVTVSEAMDLVSKRQVDAQTGLAAIQAEMSSRFSGLMAEQAKTIEGTLANVQDTVGFIMTDIGREIIETLRLRDVLGAVQEFTQGFLSWFKSLDDGTKQVLLVLTGTFAAGGPILVAVGAFMTALAVVTAPMLIGGAIIAGIVAGVTLILLNWQKIKDTGAAIWTGVKTTVVGTAEAIYTGIKTWLVDKAEVIAARVQAVAQSFAKPFEWLADHLVGHSVIPDMVEDIDRQFQALEINTTSSTRNTVVATARILEGGALTWSSAVSQFATFANNTWGSMAQTFGTSLAQMTTGTVQWGQVMQQVGVQALGQLITLAIQLMTQAALSTLFQQGEAVKQVAAHTAMESAKTAATTVGETARLGIVMATNKAMLAGVIATLGAIAAVGNAAVGTLGVVITATSSTLAAIGAALVGTIVGAPLGAAYLAASAAVLSAGTAAVGVAFGTIQAAIGAAMATASVGLALPAFAEGGAVFGPTLALVGERASRSNPEYIGHASQLGLGGGNRPTTIIVQVGSREVAREIFRELPAHVRLQGRFA